MSQPQIKYIKMIPKNKKLSEDTYIRPEITATDLLTPEEIELRLKNFVQVEVEDIKNLRKPTRIQYFEVIDDNYRYRQGGSIIVNKYPDYLVLEGKNAKTFSVQIKNHIFYKEKDYDNLKKDFEEIIIKKNRTIDEQKIIINKMYKELKKRNINIDELLN